MQQLIFPLFILALFFFAFLFFLFYFWIFPKIIYSFLAKTEKPTKRDRVLIFAPHPDDESLGCFGYIHKAIKARAKLRVVVLTDGYFTASPEKRYNETIQTLLEIGLSKKDIFFLGFKDIRLKKASFCPRIMREMIDSFKPTKIFSTSKYDSNIDHRACYYHLKKALEKSEIRPKIYYYLIHYKGKTYPLPRGFRPNRNLYPPMRLIREGLSWSKLELTKRETILKKRAVMNYKSQLRMSLFLARRTLLSFIRKNELFYSEN